MGKIYFVAGEYTPNTAPTNRLMSFIEGFSQLGINLNVVFMLSDPNNSKIQKRIPYVEIQYMWDFVNIKNRYLRQVLYSFYSWRFINKVKAGDKVLLIGPQRLMKSLLRKHGVKVYEMQTEHPFAFKIRTVNMEMFVDNCKELDGMFVISTYLKEYFIKAGIANDKIEIINMTVDPRRFDNIEKRKVETPYIAYCGTASNNKDGVDELIKAFATVSKKYPQYRLYIIGKGLTKDDDSGNLQLVRDLNLSDKVVFTGIVSSEKMPQLLKDAEILALDRPDNLQAKYGFPTKLGEYLLTGNPVVVTGVGDIPRFLTDGENALVAEPENAESFASKMVWAIENKEKSALIGLAGKDVALREFNALTESKKLAKAMGC